MLVCISQSNSDLLALFSALARVRSREAKVDVLEMYQLFLNKIGQSWNFLIRGGNFINLIKSAPDNGIITKNS